MEPSVSELAGDGALPTLKRYFLATRPKFLTASVLPVLVGSAWGYGAAGTFDTIAFLLALLTTVTAHASINVLNDVYDELGGTDRVNQQRVFPYTGGSRFIQNDVLSCAQMQHWGWSLLGAAVLLGVLLILQQGPAVLLFGLAAIALGILYSAPPIKLAGRGLGEPAVCIGLGVIPVMGAAWLQTGSLDWMGFLIALPVSFWVANILLINEVPDREADGRTGKRTLVVRYGNRVAAMIHFGANASAVLALLVAVALGLSNPWILLLPAMALLPAWSISRSIAHVKNNMAPLRKSIETTLAIHAFGSLWLVVWGVF